MMRSLVARDQVALSITLILTLTIYLKIYLERMEDLDFILNRIIIAIRRIICIVRCCVCVCVCVFASCVCDRVSLCLKRERYDFNKIGVAYFHNGIPVVFPKFFNKQTPNMITQH